LVRNVIGKDDGVLLFALDDVVEQLLHVLLVHLVLLHVDPVQSLVILPQLERHIDREAAHYIPVLACAQVLVGIGAELAPGSVGAFLLDLLYIHIVPLQLLIIFHLSLLDYYAVFGVFSELAGGRLLPSHIIALMMVPGCGALHDLDLGLAFGELDLFIGRDLEVTRKVGEEPIRVLGPGLHLGVVIAQTREDGLLHQRDLLLMSWGEEALLGEDVDDGFNVVGLSAVLFAYEGHVELERKAEVDDRIRIRQLVGVHLEHLREVLIDHVDPLHYKLRLLIEQ